MRFLTVALILAAVPAMAQEPRPSTVWGFIGLGPGGAADSGFYASGIGGGVQRGRLLYMARIASLDTKDKKRISDLGVLVGVASRPRWYSVGAALGLAAVRDVRDSTAMGLAFESYASLNATKWAAIGLRIFSCSNELADYSGLTVGLQLGRVRD